MRSQRLGLNLDRILKSKVLASHTIFDNVVLSLGATSVTSKVALRAGSSQQGNARRASVDSNCVVAAYRVIPSGVVYLAR